MAVRVFSQTLSASVEMPVKYSGSGSSRQRISPMGSVQIWTPRETFLRQRIVTALAQVHSSCRDLTPASRKTSQSIYGKTFTHTIRWGWVVESVLISVFYKYIYFRLRLERTYINLTIYIYIYKYEETT